VTPVILHWTDAAADSSGGWCTVGSLEQRPYVVRSVGFLVPTDAGGKPGHVTLVQSIGCHQGDEADPDAYDHVLHVPVGMVVRMSACG